MDNHLFHLTYGKYAQAVPTAYAYLLDFDDQPSASTQTYGLRMNGTFPLGDGIRIHYAGEYAQQNDYADGSDSNDADYFSAVLGGTIEPVTLKVGYEVLGGDGIYGFSTPLATLHAFQGWNDKFLATPANGIRDLFVILKAKHRGAELSLVYHDFKSDHDSFDYGSEWGIQAVKKFMEYYALGVKYADYSADGNPQNLGLSATDVRKLWLTAQLKF